MQLKVKKSNRNSKQNFVNNSVDFVGQVSLIHLPKPSIN